MNSFHRNVCLSVVGVLLCLGTAWAATPTISLSSPADNSTVGGRVHFTATASSPSCAKGVAAIRIYTAPHISPFTTSTAQLDATITLAPGTYDATIQAWDNCGGVAKVPVRFTVAPTGLQPARFLYLTTAAATKFRIFGYLVDSGTGALTPSRQSSIAAIPSAFSIGSDQGGFRLYSMSLDQNPANNRAAAYFIDKRNGALSPAPSSPLSSGFSVPVFVVHPSGKFIYAITDDGDIGRAGILIFRVNSNGSLSSLTDRPLVTQADPSNLVLSANGKYLYVASQRAIEAFEVDQLSGALTPLPGSPFDVNSNCVLGVTNSLANDGNFLYATIETLQIFGFKVEPTTGTLTNVPGSPFLAPPQFLNGSACDGEEITGITTEPSGRFLYAGTLEGPISIFNINAGDGTLHLFKNTSVGFGQYFGAGVLRVDPSGKYLYSFGQTAPIGTVVGIRAELIGFAINHLTGDLTVLPGSPFKTFDDQTSVTDLVVTQ